MKWCKKIFTGLDDVVGCVTLMGVILVVFVNVIARYLFNNPLTWSDELATVGFVWCIFIGAAACAKRGSHISIDVIADLLPRGARRVLDIAARALMILFNVYLTALSFQFAISARLKHTPTLKISYTLVDISATIGFLLMSVYACVDLYRAIRAPQTPESPETPEPSEPGSPQA